MAASAADLDRYEAHYTAKLWQLLPAIYRAEDGEIDGHGPLAELVARLGAQAAVLRRSMDRLWEDQSIETCDDWVIAYLGELVATNLVPRLDARGQRVDVAKTIYYRRRKGTVALLEELAKDITGWSARVVELFRRLARTRHGLDPAIGTPVATRDPVTGTPLKTNDARLRLQRAQGLIGTRTHTGAGGLADLRDVHGAALTNSAFDEYFHTADVRRGRGKTGWHNIPRLGVFVWRKKTLFVRKSTPVKVKCVGNYSQYTFDPTGRDIPLHAVRKQPRRDQWVSPEPQQMPGPITAALLEAAFDDLYGISMGVYTPLGPKYTLVDMAPEASTTRAWIDPTRGRFIWPFPPVSTDFAVDYGYGFSAEIGAGPYDRPVVAEPAGTASLVTVTNPGDMITVGQSAEIVIANSLTYPNVDDAAAIDRVVLRAGSQQRPLIRPVTELGWRLTGAGAAELTLDGIFLSGGCDLVLLGSFERVTLSCCTLDPGSWDPEREPHPSWRLAADNHPLAPTHLRIEGSVNELVIDRCITGPILALGAGRVGSLVVRDSVIQAVEPPANPAIPTPALSLRDADAMVSRTTLLGAAHLHRLEASECIFHEVVEVTDRQHGCVRFSAWPEGSSIPRQYASVMLPPRASLFTSRDFGQPGYAQLADTAGDAIAAGAEDGSEMGAFWREKNALKERALLIKYQEYLPLGLEPVVIHVT